MLRAIKEQVTLSMAAGYFSVDLLPNKSGQRCPSCNGSSSLRTKDDRFFKCFKCGVSGSVIDLTLILSGAATVSDAITKLKPLVKDWSYTTPNSHSALKSKIYDVYRSNLYSRHSTAKDYIESRGWDYESIDCGLATKGCLQDAGISNSVLEQVDLWNNYDYYTNHLVFPVYNEYGSLVHYSGRALFNTDVRWKSSKGSPAITNYFFNSRVLYQPNSSYIIVCEGISDCLSLMQMGEPVIGQFGINVEISKHAEHFNNFDYIVFTYDFDRFPLGSPNAGTYKSWSQMMPEIVKLASLLRKPIYYLRLPSLPGIKDINDWLLHIDYDIDTYKSYRNSNVTLITDLALEMYSDDKSKHQMLWKLLSAIGDKQEAWKLLSSQQDAVDYLFSILAYE